jgi:hypothetical protein
MKNTLAIVAALLLASPAFASKARMTALGNADHLTDAQTAFATPTDLLSLGEWATFEFGKTPSVTTDVDAPNAEGGFVKSMGDAKLGFYLGHHDAKINAARAKIFTAGNRLTEENPVDVFYAAKAGDLAWGVRLGYSTGKKDAAATTSKYKNDSTTLAASVAQDAWSAELGTTLTDKVAFEGTNSTDYKGKSQIHARGTYTMDTMFYSLAFDTNGGNDDGPVAASQTGLEQSTITINAIENRKVDGGTFFYGLGLSQDTNKNITSSTADVKTTTMSLPMIVGVEVDANSWMVLRGSIKQNVILSSKKIDTTPVATTDGTDSIGANTVVAAGAGFKFGKLMLDSTIESGTGATANGKINGTTLLAMGSLTYTF